MHHQSTPLFQMYVTDDRLGAFCVEHDVHGTVFSLQPVDKVHPVAPVPVQERLRAELVQMLRGHSAPFSVPVCFNGTPFQQEVWKAVMRVPRGGTISYKKLASLVGKPQAQRAVASAVAANKLAYLVPCHRVVPSDGSVGQFRWGEERKAAWLEAERVDA